MTNELEIIKQALSGLTHTPGWNKPCRPDCERCEALAAVERLEALFMGATEFRTFMLEREREAESRIEQRDKLIKSLQNEIHEWEESDAAAAALKPTFAEVEAERDTLRSRVERLEAERQSDTEILDWLADQVSVTIGRDFPPAHVVINLFGRRIGRGETLRAALRAAIKSTKENANG